VSRRTAALVLAALLGIFLALGLVQASRDAPTVDEAVDLTAGLVAVGDRDLRMNPEHGLLHHVVPAVLPVLAADPIVPRTAAYEDGDWFDYTADLIEANTDAGGLDETLFWFRIAPLVVGAATGLLLYAVAARFLGRNAGLVAALLWLTTPYFLGLSHLSSLDISFSCALIGLVLLLDRFRALPSDRRLLAVACALACALLVRHNAVLLVPVVALLVFAARHGDRRQALTGVAIVLLVPLALVWGAHRGIDPEPVDGPPRERLDGLIGAAANAGPVEALALAVPMPVEWRAGFAYLAVTSDERPAYLLGDAWDGSRLGFFPISALVKIPISFWMAAIAGAVGWSRADRRIRHRALTSVGSIGGMVALFLVLQPLNLGLRLAVPVLALVPVVAAGCVRLGRRVALVVVGIVATAQVVALVVSHPSSLAWTPPPFTHGYRYVSDSSIDFGQANEAVRTAHRRDPFVAASLLEPRGYEALPGVVDVADADPDGLIGRIAVSATALTVLERDELSWLRAYCPTQAIGEAVLIYRFEEPPNVERGPDTPAAPCSGELSRRP